jgi:hypothetical protein
MDGIFWNTFFISDNHEYHSGPVQFKRNRSSRHNGNIVNNTVPEVKKQLLPENPPGVLLFGKVLMNWNANNMTLAIVSIETSEIPHCIL